MQIPQHVSECARQYLERLRDLAETEHKMATMMVRHASLKVQHADVRCRITEMALKLCEEGRLEDALVAARQAWVARPPEPGPLAT